MNGFPLVVVEAKTPVRKAVSWVDAALQIREDYERNAPELFAAHLLSVATEGKELRYGAVGTPVYLWGPWRLEEGEKRKSGLSDLEQAAPSLLRPGVLLDILANFNLFATDRKKRRIKVVCRYQQYEGANRIVSRVLAGQCSTAPASRHLWWTPRPSPPTSVSSISTGRRGPLRSRSGRTIPARSLCRIWKAVSYRLIPSCRWNWRADWPGVWVATRQPPQNQTRSGV